MTMLMHARHPFERAPSSMERRNTIREGAAQAHRAMIKRFCIGALTVLAAGGAIAAIIALKAAIYFWVFHYY
jgi:hypothetical protein